MDLTSQLQSRHTGKIHIKLPLRHHPQPHVPPPPLQPHTSPHLRNPTAISRPNHYRLLPNPITRPHPPKTIIIPLPQRWRIRMDMFRQNLLPNTRRRARNIILSIHITTTLRRRRNILLLSRQRRLIKSRNLVRRVRNTDAM